MKYLEEAIEESHTSSGNKDREGGRRLRGKKRVVRDGGDAVLGSI